MINKLIKRSKTYQYLEKERERLEQRVLTQSEIIDIKNQRELNVERFLIDYFGDYDFGDYLTSTPWNPSIEARMQQIRTKCPPKK